MHPDHAPKRKPIPSEQDPARRDHLGVALLLSVCLHGLLMAWQWQRQPAAATAASTLEVVLVNAQSPSAPLRPEVIAQQPVDGGGDAEHGLATSALPRTVEQASSEHVLLALRQRRAELERQQRELLTQLFNKQHALDPDAPHAPPEDLGDDSLQQEQRVLSARIAALKARLQQDNARPERQVPAPAAAQAAYAAYVEAWRLRIEQLGTEHYPFDARGRIYGSLQLTVHIHRDGSLARITVDRPSEHAILNLAAQHIVQLAAPFAPLPVELNRDVLTITRTWHFTDQHLDTAP